MKKIPLSSYIPLKNKLFLRILLYFLSLLLPILIIGAFLYVNFSQKSEDDFKQKVQLNLQSSVDFIDMFVQTAQRSSVSFFYDKNVMSLIQPYDEYNSADKVKVPNIPYTLSRISNDIGDLIDNLFVYVDDQKVYTKDGLENFNYYFSSTYKFEAYDADFWRNRLSSSTYLELLSPSKVVLNQSLERNGIPFVFSKTVNGHQTELVMTVSIERIAKTIRNNALFTSTNFMILNNNDKIIWSSLDGTEGFGTAELSEVLAKNGSDSGDVRIGGQKYILTKIKSGVYGWTYYSLTPYSEFTAQYTKVFVMIVSVCVLLMIVGCVLSFVFAYNLYNPIQKIRDILLSDGDDAYPAGRQGKMRVSELDWIGMGIHQIIEKSNTFKKRLDTLSTDYIDHVLLHVMTGNKPVNEREWHKVLEEELAFTRGYFVCCSIKLSYKPAFYEEIQDVERLMILHKMKKIVESLIGQYVPSYIIESKQNVFVCLANVDEEQDAIRLKHALGLIIETFQHDSRYCGIHAGIGKCYPGTEGIPKSYHDAMSVLANSDAQQNFLIADTADLNRERSGAPHRSDQLVNTILHYIENHYEQDLYLEKIAEQMGVSSKYISKVFKEKMGVNLTDYISMTRISKAKEIMLNTDMNISDIAERVGIFSRTTFIRLFKKIEGLPPNEFRRRAGHTADGGNVEQRMEG
ncbi:helix-turn-helix domain-containing protein [Paenibacillus thalictri]|uniref:AraC family transcriptional regulator n=1 Tax=Paenibacillus thalictri TaxID=2527873 RepID=A0A4Q9DMI7_9BACL|nr:helix-turn-helix domain-containing protein [Paenibacillus thalictri]TBL75017.1 AraC family transcriptional regulator [Paenibacillus thalictri]